MDQPFNLDMIFTQFEKKNVDLKCRVCGHESFSVLMPTGTDYQTFLPWRSLKNAEKPHIHAGPSTISISCAKCGYIEQFLAQSLLEEAV